MHSHSNYLLIILTPKTSTYTIKRLDFFVLLLFPAKALVKFLRFRTYALTTHYLKQREKTMFTSH